MHPVRTICLCTAALIAAYAVPAAAQPSTSTSSWEGATHEMQKRGPRSTIHGPSWDGRYLVTGGYGHYRSYRAPRHYRQPVYGYAPGYYR
jgi:hypothetical protein